jgi:hypothetical protein
MSKKGNFIMANKITLTPERVNKLEFALRQNGITEDDFEMLCSNRFLQRLWRDIHPKSGDKTYHEIFGYRQQCLPEWSRELFLAFGDGFADPRDNV